MPQHQIHFVFWDSDNTLINTAEHHWRKHVETLKTHGIDLDEKYRKKIYENNGFQNWEWISEELGLAVPQEEYLSQIDQWYFDHIDDIQIRSGVIEALDYFKQGNVPQAVVSNGRRKSVLSALQAKKLFPYFDFILCKEDYEGRKPDPAPYQQALYNMKVKYNREDIDPAHCLVIEDDPLGVQSGEAAGMTVLHRPPGDQTSIKMLVS